MAERMKVLLAESDAPTARAIVAGLRDKGVEASAVNDAVHVVQMARTGGRAADAPFAFLLPLPL